MKRNSFKIKPLVYLFVLFNFPYRVAGEPEEDTWIEPDAWARVHLLSGSMQSEIGKCCICSEDIMYKTDGNPTQVPQQKSTEDEVSLMYFKKFITLLFNPKKLKYDSTLQVYERSLIFTLQPSQLDKIQQLQDPRDLDNVLTDIFENVRIPYMYRDGHTLHTTEASGFKALVFDIFHDMLQLTKTSEVRFLLIATLVMLLGWYFNNRYKISWLSMIFGGLFLYGYLHTYLECNRELEVNQMLEMLNRSKGTPESQKDSRFIIFLKSIFSRATNSQDLEYQQKLKKSKKISLDFCRPDHVIIMYFNDIFLKYLQVLLEQCTDTLAKLKDGLPFPYNYFAGLMLICIVGYVLKLTFKYILSPAAWAHLVHRNHAHPPPPYQAALTNADMHNDDRISGDNLRMLLNAISSVPQHNHVSGVEDLTEAIEATPVKASPLPDKRSSAKIHNNNSKEKTFSSTDKSSTSKQRNNNNSSKNFKDDNTEVTLEDLSDES